MGISFGFRNARIRVAAAQRLLSATDLPVTAVAEAVG
jgi:transcriptional regulator GlxA family with amidase domain